MDPITTVIVAALAAGAAAGVTDVAKQAIVDAYDGLKRIIQTRFGGQSDLSNAITSLESKPDSAGRKDTLQEEVAATQADQDEEVLAAVQALEEKLLAQGDVRIQKMLRSEGGEQTMRGRGGQATQNMSDSPRGKQRME
jgi:hypothetical protein